MVHKVDRNHGQAFAKRVTRFSDFVARLFTNSTRSGHEISLPDHFNEDAHDANEEDEIDDNGRYTRDFVDPIQLRILHPTTEKRNKYLAVIRLTRFDTRMVSNSTKSGHTVFPWNLYVSDLAFQRLHSSFSIEDTE